MTEKTRLVYEGYRHQMARLHCKELRLNRESARALYEARMLGKAANFIWQKNWEAAATRFNRTQKEINELADMYSALRFQISELRYNARALQFERKWHRENMYYKLRSMVRK